MNLQTKKKKKIVDNLHGRFRISNWKLVYSTQVHGISLNTFYSKLEDVGPNLVIIEDSKGYVFGGFASESWRIEPHYYGNGECFLFTLKPRFEVFHWTHKNKFFMCSRQNFFAMGGG